MNEATDGADKLRAALEESRARVAAVTPLPYTESLEHYRAKNITKHGKRAAKN